MNCRNFPEIATSIARAELIDAATLEEARAHAAVCEACGARLADELRLSDGLKVLAVSDESRPLKGFDEARLRELFRANAADASPARRPGFSYIRLAAGIAAAVVVAVGATILWRPTHVDPVAPGEIVAKVTPTVQIEKPSARLESARAPREDAVSPRPASIRSSRAKSRGRVDGSYVDARLSEFTAASLEPEETTEFIPTIQGSNLAPLSSGQVMRVMVPKSAMSYFGLPVNIEQANERVAADVLMGEDGVARAIRFVR
jgi:hypothetical protein